MNLGDNSTDTADRDAVVHQVDASTRRHFMSNATLIASWTGLDP